MTLYINTLGALRVRFNDTELPAGVWKTLKHKALFEILLTFRKRPLTREQLTELLWSHLDPASADRNLRVTISQLRHALAPPDASLPSDFILTTDHGYAWNLNADYWLDAREFETLSASSEQTPGDTALAERAYALYRADYLEQERYADWATAERERLRELFFALVTRMADTYARRGQYRRAIALVREILAADRCRESVWRQLMLYHYHAGDPALALRAFEECRSALALELDIEPLPETITLAGDVRRRRLAGEPAYPPPIELERLRQLPVSLSHLAFVGRQAEWSALLREWNAARAGESRVVLLEGDAGIGKTRLAEQLVAYARSQGAIVMEGKGRELSSALPYQPLIDALRGTLQIQETVFKLDPLWRVELGRLVPEWGLSDDLQSAAPSSPERSRLFEAVTRLLRRVSLEAPLLVFLDDAQWFDEATISLLSYWSNARAKRVLLLMTVRADQFAAASPLTIWWTELERARALARIPLAPLTSEAVTRLVAKASGDSAIAPRIAAHLNQESGGYPLFLIALLQGLFEDGLLYADEHGTWFGAENLFTRDPHLNPLPPAIAHLLSQRLQRLDARVQRMLGVAAVIGRPFALELLQSASRQPESDLLDDLDRALQRRILRTSALASGTGYELNHDLIRRALYDSLAPDRRAHLHRRVLEALEQHPEGAGASNVMELAYHAARGGLWHSAVVYSIKAAEWALDIYAIQEALRQCESGLAALNALVNSEAGRADPRRSMLWHYDLLAAKQLSEHLLGKRDLALLDQMRSLARELQDPERLARADYALMRHYIDTGQNDAALELLPAYAPIVAQNVSPRTALRFHQRVGFLFYRVGDFDRALYHHDEALRLAATVNDPHWQAYVLNTRGTVLMCLGRYQDALADFTRAAEIWQSPTREIFRTFALDNRAEVLCYLGQYDRALADKEQALLRYREYGYPIAEAECLAEIGVALRELGRTDRAEKYLQEGIQLSTRLGDSFDLAQSLIALAALCLCSDDMVRWQSASEHAARAVAEGQRANLPHAVIFGLAYGAQAALQLSRPGEALALSTRAVTLLAGRGHIEGAEEEIYYIHSRVLRANARPQEAHSALERAYAELMAKLRSLTDPELKRSFLEQVRVNRAILAAR